MKRKSANSSKEEMARDNVGIVPYEKTPFFLVSVPMAPLTQGRF